MHRNVRVVPYTPMVKYFRDLPKSRSGRLGVARALQGDPSELASLLTASVDKFAAYDNDEAFYPMGRTYPVEAGHELRRTIDVARRLEAGSVWTVRGDRALDFVYVDRELVPARTTGGAIFSPGGRPRLDLLLENAHDRTPIIGELKIGTDRDSFYALIQLLALASQLLTGSQRRRLHKWGRMRGAWADLAEGSVLDLYVLAVGRSGDTYLPELHDATQTIAAKLVELPEFARMIRRIAFLDAVGTPDGLRFNSVFAYSVERPH
jgi:hypothetical protein